MIMGRGHEHVLRGGRADKSLNRLDGSTTPSLPTIDIRARGVGSPPPGLAFSDSFERTGGGGRQDARERGQAGKGRHEKMMQPRGNDDGPGRGGADGRSAGPLYYPPPTHTHRV